MAHLTYGVMMRFFLIFMGLFACNGDSNNDDIVGDYSGKAPNGINRPLGDADVIIESNLADSTCFDRLRGQFCFPEMKMPFRRPSRAL